MTKWEIILSEQYERDLKGIKKRYPRELAQMTLNLERYYTALQEINNPLLLVEFSFVHRETSGCHAITQQPLHSAAQTRLYVYCCTKDKELHLICAGDKKTQTRDNQYCKLYVSQI